MTVTQREIVYTTTTSVFATHGVSFTPSTTNVKDIITDELRAEITQHVMSAFKAKQVELKDTESNRKKMESDAALKSYVSGLLTNWFGKDNRLNGGQGGEKIASRGRFGSDPEIKRLRNLHKTLLSSNKTEEAAVVEQEIAERLRAAKAAKTA